MHLDTNSEYTWRVTKGHPIDRSIFTMMLLSRYNIILEYTVRARQLTLEGGGRFANHGFARVRAYPSELTTGARIILRANLSARAYWPNRVQKRVRLHYRNHFNVLH